MTRMRMLKSTLECGIVPRLRIALLLTPLISPGQRLAHSAASENSQARRQESAEYATFGPFLYKNLNQLTSSNVTRKRPLANARYSNTLAQQLFPMCGIL